MIAGVNSEQKLFVSDITGNYVAYKAMAIGENDEKIKEHLRKKYSNDLTIEDATKLALRIFREVLGKNFDIGRFDVGYIEKNDRKLKRISGERLKKYIK